MRSDVDQIYDDTLGFMEDTLHRFARCVPAPQPVPFRGGVVFRYVEKTIQQALVQKLARMVTGLHAARLLMLNGFLQEQATLQRVLDELREDVSFLACAVIYDDVTPLHQVYLEGFYREEFDPASAATTSGKRPMVPRQKIHAFLAEVQSGALDPSRGVDLARTMSKTYSGYVHAASPHIMDMYGGTPLHFHVSGMRGTARQKEHRDDLWSYFFRGTLAFALVAKAFGGDELCASILAFSKELQRWGNGYEPINPAHVAGRS